MVKPKVAPNKNLRDVEEIIILPEKLEDIWNELKQIL